MKLTITNETAWSSRDLRAFIAAGLRAEGVEGKGHWRVRVCYLRGGRGSSGYASYNSTRMCLRLVNPTGKSWYDAKRRDLTTLPDYDKADLAHTLWHEVAHCRGIRHRDMQGGWCGNSRGAQRDGPMPAWAATLTIGIKLAAVKPTKDQVTEERMAVLDSRLAEWNRKLKLARTKVRKYEQARKRAGLRLAALRAPPATPTPTPS